MKKRIFTVVTALCVMCGLMTAQTPRVITQQSEPALTQGLIGPQPASKANFRLPKAKKVATVKPPMRAESADETPVLYGSLISYTAGGASDKTYGIYSFPASADLTFTSLVTSPNMLANAGATYANGKYYFIYYTEAMGALLTYYRIADADTWELLSSFRVDNTSLCTDLTYDPTTETIYGCFRNAAGTGYVFGTMSKADASVTPISALETPLFTLASDVNGTLYGITAAGNLVTVNKETGKLTTVGATGLKPAFTQSMTFDMATGRLFWTACTERSNGLYEVDPKTGAATLIKLFDGNEEFAGLYTRSQGAAAKAPGELTDFKADYDVNSVSDIKVSFTMPSKAYDGSALTGKVKWTVMLDDVEIESGEANAGAKVTTTLSSVAVGMHTITACARNDSGKGPQSKERKWIGVDTPLPLENVKLSFSGETATLAWDDPKGSAHNGYFDPAKVSYRVIRQPGNIVVCDKTTDRTITDRLEVSRLTYYYYDVVTFVGETQGETTPSNKILVGEAFSIPYTENFSNADNFNLFTVIDANHDGKYWTWEEERAKSGYSVTNDMDDWLITPPMKFDSGYIYTMRFSVSTRSYVEKFNVWFGTEPTVEGMTKEILPTMATDNKEPRQITIQFRPTATGPGYLGIHQVSDRACYNIFIDDIEVVRAASVKAPAAIADLTVTPADKGALKCSVSFHAPSTSIDGAPLTSIKSISLFHGDRIIKKFTNPAPGAALTHENITCAKGDNSFRIFAENEIGHGLESTASAFIGPDIPGAANNIHLQEKDGKAVLTWDAPTEGHNGGYIDPATLKYYVGRQNFVNGGIESAAENITERTFSEVPVLPGQQGSVAYYVYAVSDQGNGYGYPSNVIIMGTPYSLPWKESFPNAAPTYETWRPEVSDPYSTWGLTEAGVYPSCQAYDLDNGMISYQPGIEQSWGILTSGKISLKDAATPIVEFNYYHKNHSEDKITLLISSNGVDFEPVGVIDMNATAGTSGWRKASFPIPAYANKDFIRLGFRVDCDYSLTSIHLDNIVVRNRAEKDLSLDVLTPPATFKAGEPGVFKATVSNLGSKDADAFTVTLYRDGEQIDVINGTALAAGEQREFEFTLTPDVSYPDVSEYYATVTYEGDADTSNNTSNTVKAIVVRPIFPVVTDLQGSFNESTSTVDLSWSAPDMKAGPSTTDNFENYNSFIIKNIGDWQTVDLDLESTIYILDAPMWTNCSDPQAFIVFNARQLGLDSDPMYAPHSGEQMLISFSSAAAHNDDWLISPRLSGNAQTISFWARSLTSQDGNETFEFLTTDDQFRESTGSFVKVEEVPGEVGSKWTEFKVDVPAGTQYFAIRCTSANKWGLCIDDITYIPAAAEDVVLQGYDVLCNGKTLNEAPQAATTFSQGGIDVEKSYRFSVVCVFDKGKSAPSNEYAAGKLGLDGIGSDAVSVRAVGSEIVISGGAGQAYAVYTPAGLTVALGIAAPVERVAAPEGIYLVKVGSKTYKVALGK